MHARPLKRTYANQLADPQPIPLRLVAAAHYTNRKLETKRTAAMVKDNNDDSSPSKIVLKKIYIIYNKILCK